MTEKTVVHRETEKRRRLNYVAFSVSLLLCVLQGDLFKADISQATSICPRRAIGGSPKLMRELKPGARVVSHRFDMYDWRPDQERSVGGWLKP